MIRSAAYLPRPLAGWGWRHSAEGITRIRYEKGRWRRIWGVVEPTAADCCADGAPWDAEVACSGFGPAPLWEILAWAGSYTGHVTLYLYDREPFGSGDTEDDGS